MNKRLLRTYEGSDTFMLESAEVMQAAFVGDLADFTAFDTSLDAAFATAWNTAIAAARATATDPTIVGEQKDRTQQVQAAMEQCRNAYTDLIYFAEKAFRTQPGILKKFGKGESYLKARQNQPRMLELMEEIAATATEYTAQLTAAGAPASVINAPAAAHANLKTLNIDQNLYIKDRMEYTRERIEAYNAVYAIMAQVVEAAQRVYRNNREKRNQYIYNPPSSNLRTISLSLPPSGVIATLLNAPYRPGRDIRLRTTAPIEVALSTDGTNPGINGWLPVTAGPTHSADVEDLGPEGDFIIARNTGTETADILFKYEE